MKRESGFGWAAAVLLLLLTSCATTGRHDSSMEAAQARLLRNRKTKQWTAVKSQTGGPTPVEKALLHSRRRMQAYLPETAPEPQIASARIDGPEPQDEGKKVGPAKTEVPQDPISVHFRGTPLGEAIDLLAQPLGLNILLSPDLVQPVTVNFPSIKPREAIDAILSQHGMELKETKGIWRIRPQDFTTEMVTETILVKTGKMPDEGQLKSFLTAKGKLQMAGTGTSLVVSDEPEAIKRLKAYLEVTDRRRPQVLIEALIMEVQHDSGFGLGMIASTQNNGFGDFQQNAVSDLALGTGNMGTMPFLLNIVNNDWESQLELTARENISLVNVLSNPLLTTVSGKEAKLEVIEKVPYIEATQQISTDGGAAQSSSEEIAFADVGVRLTVTPEVGGDDIVEMKVKPEVLELVDFVLGTPVIDERIVETTVYVRNNETIVLAGLLREGLTTTTDKVPFLGDIPLLDALFRREEERTEKRELLIFLTPHLIGPGAAPHKGFQPQQYLLDQMRMFPEVNKVLTKKSLGR